MEGANQLEYEVYNTDERTVHVKKEPLDQGYETNVTVNGKPNEYGSGEGDTAMTGKSTVDQMTMNDMLLSSMNRGSDDIQNPTDNNSTNSMPASNDSQIQNSHTFPNEGNESFLEFLVTDADNIDPDTEAVCAVASKVIITSPLGEILPMADVSYFWCNFCSYKAKSKEDIQQHVSEHRFHCKYCKYHSFSRASVVKHCIQEHDSFVDKAKSLKYCFMSQDLPQFRERGSVKRKSDSETVNGNPAKRPKFSESGNNMHSRNSYNAFKNILPDSSSNIVSEQQAVITPATSPSKSSVPAFPVITNIVSGEQAVCAALGTNNTESESIQHDIETNVKSEPANTYNDDSQSAPVELVPHSNEVRSTGSRASSNLSVSAVCWTCGYCNHKSLGQNHLKYHLNHAHKGQPHMYVAMLITSEEELEKVKESDAEAEGAGPPTMFKCSHCNFNDKYVSKVKGHEFERHRGGVYYALDMKAVKTQGKRYVFFCFQSTCDYFTKDTDDFLKHADKCTPMDEASNIIDKHLMQSLELTRNFIEKTIQNGNFGLRSKQNGYGCPYCLYICDNNTRLKKHILCGHSDQEMAMNDLNEIDKSTNTKCKIYFCKHCLWECSVLHNLNTHIVKRHPDKVEKRTTDKAGETAAHDVEKSSKHSIDDTNNLRSLNETPARSKKVHKLKKKSPVSMRNLNSSSLESTEDRNEPYSSIHPCRGSVEREVTAEETEEGDGQDFEQTYSSIMTTDQYKKAMAAYVEFESKERKQPTVDRPSRNAALKCKMKVKNSIKRPSLFKCQHCNNFVFSELLVKKHLRDKHKTEPLFVIDIVRQEKHCTNSYTFFCPVDMCAFSAAFTMDIVNHAKNSHGLQSTHTDLLKMTRMDMPFPTQPSKSSRGRRSTAATGEAYECLYCPKSLINHSRRDMKIHLIQEHGREDFIYRDCVAHKLKQNSRFYMCKEVSCDYTGEMQKDYLLHMLAHGNTRIYQCSICRWFTANSDEVDVHKKQHKDKMAIMSEIDLSINTRGETVMVIDGTVIKNEFEDS